MLITMLADPHLKSLGDHQRPMLKIQAIPRNHPIFRKANSAPNRTKSLRMRITALFFGQHGHPPLIRFRHKCRFQRSYKSPPLVILGVDTKRHVVRGRLCILSGSLSRRCPCSNVLRHPPSRAPVRGSRAPARGEVYPPQFPYRKPSSLRF